MWNSRTPARMRSARFSLWGDGLVDQSLSTLWYAPDWGGVDLDELTFFIPALLCRSALANLAERGSGGPAGHIRNALGRRLIGAVEVLSRVLAPEAAGQQAWVLQAIDKIAILSLPADVLWAEKEGLRRGGGGGTFDLGWPLRRGLREAAIYELSVLACLDRMMRDASALCRGEAAPTAAGSNVSAADALIASIHSGLNGSYVYSDLTYMHETFATGAWLGTVLSGRAALLPQFMAEILWELFERVLQRGEASMDDTDRVLLEHARLAVGEYRLRRAVRRVARHGIPAVVRTKRLETAPWSRCPIWNRELNGRISLALDSLINSR